MYLLLFLWDAHGRSNYGTHTCSYIYIYIYIYVFVYEHADICYICRLGNAHKIVGIDVNVWDYIENKFHQWSLHEDHEEALLSKLEGSGIKIKGSEVVLIVSETTYAHTCIHHMII